MPTLLNRPKTLDEIRQQYANDKTARTFQCLLAGRSGAGKTTMCATANPPILIDQFDAHGTDGLRSEIDSGKVVVQRFDQEDPESPTAFRKWQEAMQDRESSGVFDSVGTYVIDSWTWWFEAYSNFLVHSNPTGGKRNPSLPMLQLQDYGLALTIMPNLVKRIQRLPCDIIITAHMDREADPVTGKMETSVAVFKSMKVKLPTLFNEMYVVDPRNTSKGMIYEVVTQPDGTYFAKTALGKGKFDLREPADFQHLFKKAGR